MNKGFKNPYSKNGKTLLFTTQDKKSLEILNETGRFFNKRQYIRDHFEDISEHFIKSYDWFVKEASKRIEKPSDVEYQIWCSVSARNCMRPSENEVSYIIEVPNDEIIYFSGMKWDYILNLHYVALSDEDLVSYQKDIKEKGFSNSYEFIEGRYSNMFPKEVEKIKESWPRVFEINNWNIFDIQANIWEIKKEWVKCVINVGEKIEDKYIMD